MHPKDVKGKKWAVLATRTSDQYGLYVSKDLALVGFLQARHFDLPEEARAWISTNHARLRQQFPEYTFDTV